MARLLLGVSGGIAAYKALEFVRLATATGHAVRVIQTPASLRFVGSASFASLTGAAVLVDEFEPDPDLGAFPGQARPDHRPLSHLELVDNADVYLIAPASANTIARLAGGLADNLLCTSALAASCPVAVAPAMNDRMYRHSATVENLATLRRRGISVIDPAEGRLGSPGEWGLGRLAEPAELLAACERLLAGGCLAPPTGPWDGLNVLVSAGGTREPIDSVRFVGNRSSGRMGFALADAAAARGARVTVVAANVDLPRQPGVHYVDVQTAAECKAACEQAFADCDVLLMAAAVADFRPGAPDRGKISKSDQGALTVAMEPTEDIIAALAAARRSGQVIVGFAAEHGPQGVGRARAKLRAKGLDAVVVNDISRSDIGFDSLRNEVSILTSCDELAVARADKTQVATAVLDAVDRLRAGWLAAEVSSTT